MQIDYLVLVKKVAWKGRHKIQNKWEPEEYVVLQQPNKRIQRVKHVGNGNMLLSLGIKFIPKIDPDTKSDQEEEPKSS